MNITTINNTTNDDEFTSGIIMLVVFLILFCVLLVNLCLNSKRNVKSNFPQIYGCNDNSLNIV